MTFENRVSEQLRRAAPTNVPDAPSFDEMAAVVSRRRRRNRLAVRGATAIVGIAALGGALVLRAASDSTELETAAPQPSAAGVEETRSQSEEGGANSPASPDLLPTDSTPAIVDSGIELVETPGDPPPGAGVELQAPGNAVTVATRVSTLDFAGASGVLLVATESGYSGLASRFGGDNGVTAIGLVSTNGLDWDEIMPVGIPAGATANALTRDDDGTWVALFSLFDVERQRNDTIVGTSTDLVNWSLSAPLVGDDTAASDLAVGPAGVLVLGAGPNPVAWVGQVGGPYVQAGAIDDAHSIVGLAVTKSGFVVVGSSSELGATLFQSPDAADWTRGALDMLDDGDVVVGLSSFEAGLLMGGGGAGAPWAALSMTDGQSWQRRELSTGSVGDMVSGNSSFSFLGRSAEGVAAVTVSDGDSFVVANIDVEPSERLSLLVSGPSEAVLLSSGDSDTTWIVVSR